MNEVGRRLNVANSIGLVSFDELASDPSRVIDLTPADRRRLQLQCAAVLAALAVAPAAEEELLLEPAEAARRMRVGRTTVYEMLRDGSLAFITKGKRGRLIPESEIEAWKLRNLRRGSDRPVTAIRARVEAAPGKENNVVNSQATPAVR